MEQFGVVVGAVVIESGSVLLLQRSERETFLPGVWGIPAGKVAYGEPLEHAAVRELREEAGLQGTVKHQSGSTWFESQLGGDVIRSLQVNFVIHVDSRDVCLDKSSQDYMWLELDSLCNPDVPIDEFTRQSIANALEPREGQVSSGQ